MKKLLLSFLIGITFLFSLAPFFEAKAQTSWFNQNPMEWYAKVYDDTNPNEIFGERYTAAQVQWITYSVFFLPINIIFSLLGEPPTPMVCIANMASGTTDVQTCIGSLTKFLLSLADKFALASANTNSALTQNSNSTLTDKNDKNYILKQIFAGDRQPSGIGYVKDLVNKLNPVSTVNAANTTFGYNRLTIILPLWKITRNIAFSFFVLIVIIVAFMVMFKVKISPQAVVTLQQSLPKILIALLLVTFSYAIAGFVIDLVYVVMGIFSQFFPRLWASTNGALSGSSLATWQFLNGWGADGFLAALIYTILYMVMSIVNAIVITIVSIFKGFAFSSILFGALMIIFFAINIIIMVIYLFVVLFNLFKALAMFYVEVILGPIKLAIGALPMSNGAFSGWIKALLSRALVFPVTGILWYFGFMFQFAAFKAIWACRISGGLVDVSTVEAAVSRLFEASGAPTDLVTQFTAAGGSGPYSCWGPPMLRNAGSATSIAFLLISASCILLLAKVPKMLETFFAGKPFDFESAISEPVKTGASAVGSYIEEKGKLPFIPVKIPKAVGELLKMMSRTRV